MHEEKTLAARNRVAALASKEALDPVLVGLRRLVKSPFAIGASAFRLSKPPSMNQSHCTGVPLSEDSFPCRV